MIKEDIIRMAREAGFNVEQGFLLRVTGVDEDLERFAALVVEHERNECAQVVETIDRNGAWVTKEEAASAIRARS